MGRRALQVWCTELLSISCHSSAFRLLFYFRMLLFVIIIVIDVIHGSCFAAPLLLRDHIFNLYILLILLISQLARWLTDHLPSSQSNSPWNHLWERRGNDGRGPAFPHSLPSPERPREVGARDGTSECGGKFVRVILILCSNLSSQMLLLWLFVSTSVHIVSLICTRSIK